MSICHNKKWNFLFLLKYFLNPLPVVTFCIKFKMLFGNVIAGKVHSQLYISVFGNKKKVIIIGGTHQFSLLRHRFGEAAFRGDFLLTVEYGSTVQ